MSARFYETVTAAQFTEIHDITIEQFDLWVLAGRPTLMGRPVICETLQDYQQVMSDE